MKNICLIGAGAWGKNYIHTLSNLPVNFTVANRANWKSLVDKNPDGVIIATPPDSHIEISSYVLDKKIPVMVEKPLALSSNDAMKLSKYSIPILINNIHLFAPAYIALVEEARNRGIFDIISSGTNIGPYRNYSVLFDYTPHDLSMGMYLTKNKTPKLQFIEKLKVEVGEDYNIFINYDDIAHHIKSSNIKDKSRIFEIHCCNGDILTYDNLAKDKFCINNIPQKISNTSPLNNATQYFLKMIDGEKDDRFGIDLSIAILTALEAAQRKCL